MIRPTFRPRNDVVVGEQHWRTVQGLTPEVHVIAALVASFPFGSKVGSFQATFGTGQTFEEGGQTNATGLDAEPNSVQFNLGFASLLFCTETSPDVFQSLLKWNDKSTFVCSGLGCWRTVHWEFGIVSSDLLFPGFPVTRLSLAHADSLALDASTCQTEKPGLLVPALGC